MDCVLHDCGNYQPFAFLKTYCCYRLSFKASCYSWILMSWSTINATNWCISKPLPTTKCYNITCCKILKPSKALPRKVLNISQLLLNNCFHISDKETSNLHLILHSIWLVTYFSNSSGSVLGKSPGTDSKTAKR